MKQRVDHDAVLNLWQAGEISTVIACMTECSLFTVNTIVVRARRAGDPRAVLRGRGFSNLQGREEAQRAMKSRNKRRRWAKKFPTSFEELHLLVQSCTAPITVCRPGWPADYVPRIVKELTA